MAIITNNNGVEGSSVTTNPSYKPSNSSAVHAALSKVPEVTLIFWLIKIASTTLGETAGDALSMSLNLGYLVSTGIFAVGYRLCRWFCFTIRPALSEFIYLVQKHGQYFCRQY